MKIVVAALRAVLVPLGVALVVGGCASVADVTGTATQTDLAQLRADVTALQLTVQRMKTEVDRQSAQADARTREDTHSAQQLTDEVSRRVDALATTLTTLTGRVDELATRVEGLSRRPSSSSSVPATATPKPFSAPPTGPGTPPPPLTASPPRPLGPAPPASATATARPPASGVQPADLYQAAYLDFSKGSYQLAIAGFREFLRRYPEHELAGNAQYWIGEAHFSLARSYANATQPDKATEELEHAVQEFRKVVANYPRGGKAPTALYKEALALIELKQPALAQARLQYLIDNFPQAEETPLARERLASLRGG